jgi:hypothetical protein
MLRIIDLPPLDGRAGLPSRSLSSLAADAEAITYPIEPPTGKGREPLPEIEIIVIHCRICSKSTENALL